MEIPTHYPLNEKNGLYIVYFNTFIDTTSI